MILKNDMQGGLEILTGKIKIKNVQLEVIPPNELIIMRIGERVYLLEEVSPDNYKAKRYQ